MALLIPTAGEILTITPKDPVGGFTCKELYEILGHGCRCVEVHACEYLGKRYLMVMDEDGKIRNDPPDFNARATDILFFANVCKTLDDFVVGHVVLCSGKEFQ